MSVQPLILKGSPHQRGLIHGEALRRQIGELLGKWKNELANGFGMDADEVIRRFLKSTDFPTTIQRYTPDLIEEIHGIAEGSAQPYDTLFAFQLLDELWASGDVVAGSHCTSIGFNPHNNEPTWLGQNLDVETFRDGYQTVLHIYYPDSDLEALVVTSAGLIGFNGMNNHAVGLCCNGLLPCNSRLDGLPVACVVRGVIAQPSQEAARRFLMEIPHATGQNYMVGGPQGVIDIECSANQKTTLEMGDHPRAIWHANLPLANSDTHADYREAVAKQEPSPFRMNNETRYASVGRQLEKRGAKPPLEFLKESLASQDPSENPICSTKDGPGFFTQIGIYSFAATIMELSSTPALYINTTPQDPNFYTRLGFT